MTYQRKCKNWLTSYKDWVMPRMAAPASYIFWSGVFCIPSALRRKVCIGKSQLGNWECYPHCYIMLVGPPGFRKNTSMGPALELLQDLSDVAIIQKAPSIATKEYLLDGIFKSPDSSIYLAVEEFGDIMLKSGPDMYELFTTLFDAKKHLDQGTFSRKYEIAVKPCLNMLAGTTPKWIADKMPESVIGGGFASRVLFIYEDKQPSHKIFFRGVSDEFKKLRDDLISDLSHIANNIEGEFIIDPKVQDWFEQWNEKMEKSKLANPKLSGYYARKITYIFKLAQIYRLSYSDDLELGELDLQMGIDWIESTEKNLPKVFAGVGKNEYALDTREIYDTVLNHPGIEKDKLLRLFRNVGTADRIEQFLSGLIQMKLISYKYIDDSKTTLGYYPNKEDDG